MSTLEELFSLLESGKRMPTSKGAVLMFDCEATARLTAALNDLKHTPRAGALPGLLSNNADIHQSIEGEHPHG